MRGLKEFGYTEKPQHTLQDMAGVRGVREGEFSVSSKGLEDIEG